MCSLLSSTFECRTFNFDKDTKQCQLLEGDTIATGSIIPSSSSPIAGSIDLLESDYKDYGKSCDHCDEKRFLRCVNNTCDCRQHTYWNGTLCLPQLLIPCARDGQVESIFDLNQVKSSHKLLDMDST